MNVTHLVVISVVDICGHFWASVTDSILCASVCNGNIILLTIQVHSIYHLLSVHCLFIHVLDVLM